MEETNKSTTTTVDATTTNQPSTTTNDPISPYDPAATYAEQLATIKSNMVDRASYDKVVAQNRQLAESLANNRTIASAEPSVPSAATIDQLTAAYQSTMGMNSNLAPAKAALELRDAVLAKDGIDLFAPNARNSRHTPKAEDLASAQRAAEVIRSCINDCNGSDSVFFSLLCDRTEDDPTLLRSIAARNKKTR